MTARELLTRQLEDSGYQLDQVLAGMTDADLDHRMTPPAMTPREQVAHLCEVYLAVLSELAGEKHAWGTFVLDDPTWSHLKGTFDDLRARAVAGVLGRDDERALHLACDFILGHDYYHVGQLAASRLVTQPEWDSYAIYRSS